MPSGDEIIKPWDVVESARTGDYRIFTIRTDRKTSPRTGSSHEFYIIDCVNWVNVIPVTTDGQLVMVEQFRHGTNTVELEVPGGIMDGTDDSPVHTGIRELREETGYEGSEAQVIGQVYPNPAIMSNICYTVLVQDCTIKHPTAFDHAEDLITRLVPIAEIPNLVRGKKVRHSLVLAALYHFDLWQRVK